MPNNPSDGPPHTPLSQPGKGNLTVTPRPKGGIGIHNGGLCIALSPAECNRLKFEINRYSIERRDGIGYYQDRRVDTESTGKYVANRGRTMYSTETPK